VEGEKEGGEGERREDRIDEKRGNERR